VTAVDFAEEWSILQEYGRSSESGRFCKSMDRRLRSSLHKYGPEMIVVFAKVWTGYSGRFSQIKWW